MIDTLKRRPYVAALLIAIVASVTTYALALAVGWTSIDTTNWLEMAAVATSYACTYLFIVQERAAYVVGMGTTALYVVVFWQANLLASALLNAYLVVTLLYGLWAWGKRKGETTARVSLHHWSLRSVPIYLLVTTALFGGAYLLVSALGGSFAPADAIILAFTILAQLLTDRKVLEAWVVWVIGVNVAGTILYFTSGLYFVAMQQFIFGVASAITFFVWLREYQGQKRDAAILRHPAGKAVLA